MGMSGISLLFLGLAVLVPTVLAARALTGPVPRRRVEEFARLHSLAVTAGNGNQIIAYRATTRRWRTAGLALSMLVQLVCTGHVALDFWWVLAGWFAGAIVAELRVAHLSRGPRAVASLAPRRVAHYLPTLGRAAVPGSMVLCAVVACVGFVQCVTDRSFAIGDLITWTALGLGVGAVTLAATRHVLRRSQPYAEPDKLAADDAIRSRSLHVLAGAGMTLVLYCVLGQLWACGAMTSGVMLGLGPVLGLGAAVAGRILAYWPWVPRRTLPEPA
jgi:hypothetical protein